MSRSKSTASALRAITRQSRIAFLTVGVKFIKFTLLFTPSAALFAQCSLEGHVLNPARGGPVRRAEVFLGPPESPQIHRALTGADGGYRLPGIAPGRYRLSAQRLGFWPTHQWLTLSDCRSVRKIDLTLLPGAAISGRVYDENGEPLLVSVQLWRETWKSGHRELREITRGPTEEGAYRFFGLAAGQYYVSTAQTPIREVRQAYQQTFHPSPLKLSPGSEARDVDFHLNRTPTVTLGLDIQGLLAPDQYASIDLENTDTHAKLELATNDPKFEIDGLTTGSYKLTVTSREADQTYYALLNIDVGTVDIHTLAVQLAPTLDVRAKLRFEGPPPYPVAVPMRLSPLQTAHPDETGSYAWSGVVPGTYSVTADLPDAFYMKSSGTVEISRVRQDPFKFVAGAGAARLEGAVQFPDSVDHVRVILIGTRIEKTALTNADGTFTLRGIAPGRYTLTAVEEDDDQNWRDPDTLKALAAKGVRLELAPGEAAHRDLALTR